MEIKSEYESRVKKEEDQRGSSSRKVIRMIKKNGFAKYSSERSSVTQTSTAYVSRYLRMKQFMQHIHTTVYKVYHAFEFMQN